MMAWSYMVICIFDFVIAPILWSIFQASNKGNVSEPWVYGTLQGAGLFHMAMGAILGVTAWSRGQEKMSMMDSTRKTSPSQYSSPAREKEYEYESEPERDVPVVTHSRKEK